MVLATKHKERTDQPYKTRAQLPFGSTFSNHMGNWLEEYHGQDSRFHWLPTSCHRSSKAAALLNLEPAQTARSRQGFCSLYLWVGEGSQVTPGRVVLVSAAGKDQDQSRNSSTKRENHRLHNIKKQKDLTLPILQTWYFQIHRRKLLSSVFPVCLAVRMKYGEIRRNLFYVNIESN